MEGKVAAITGGNSGLGLAIAKRFKAEGASVAILGRKSETLKSAVNEIGGDTLSSRGDVRSLSDLEDFFSKISEHFGRVDIVVANAGGGLRWEWALDRPEGEAIKEGLKAGAVGTMWLADGTKIFMKQVAWFIDNDNIGIQRTLQTDGDEEISEIAIRARRVK